MNNVVSLPIFKPKNWKSGDDYKIQLSFDGDRVVTPWLKILGPRAPEAPVLVIELTRSGDALVAVRGAMESLPPSSADGHRVKMEFEDEAVWPKHLTVGL